MSVYMSIPVMPLWAMSCWGTTPAGVIMFIYGVGLFLLGGFCSYWVQRYRRNRVCLRAIVALMLSYAVFYYAVTFGNLPYWVMLIARLASGMSFGVAQMVLMSTLIIDTSESFQRTEANHSASWFGRFALSLGPLTALILTRFGNRAVYGLDIVMLGAMACCLVAIVLILAVKFPFKAPEEQVHTYTLDRFFLPQGIWIFLNLLLVTVAVGLLLSLSLAPMFYCMMMTGFLLALISQKYVFANAELKSEIVCGLFLIACALLMLLSHQKTATDYISPVFIGTGTGIIGARFLLFFIKLSRHCQRGTSQSTFFLAWELGLSIGLGLGYAFFGNDLKQLIFTALLFVVLAFVMYQCFTHSWYLTHKNR